MPKVKRENKSQTESLLEVIKRSGRVPKKPKEPIWHGPYEDGVTQSLIQKFLVCRERFRLLVIKGLKGNEGWNHRTGYGDFWHLCEEEHDAGRDWRKALKEKAQADVKEYRNQQNEIDKWYNVCKVQFPLYLDYWGRHKTKEVRESLLQEEVFCIPYELPSERIVWLRGKIDGIELLNSGPKTLRGLYVVDHKTKSVIDQKAIEAQLRFDLQTMFYMVAVQTLKRIAENGAPEGIEPEHILPEAEHWGNVPGLELPLRGIVYNAVRRPLSGGKGTIKRKEDRVRKPKNKAEREKYGEKVPVPGETWAEYYERLAEYIRNEPESYFVKWDVTVTDSDINTFRRRTLDPVLEGLCDWWDWIKDCKEGEQWDNIHWQHPFGVYNVLNEGGRSDLDEYLLNGSEVGLVRTNNLFRELG